VTPQTIAAYQLHLGEYRYQRGKCEPKELKQRTRVARLSAVCRFFRWLVAKRVLLVDPTAQCIVGDPGPYMPANVLTESEVAAMINGTSPRKLIGMRDRAILELLYSSGLRREELIMLDIGDIDFAAGTVHVRFGKRGKSRIVPLGETAAKALTTYIQVARPQFFEQPGVVALFLAANGNGFAGKRLSGQSIGLIVRAAARRAGIERPVTPHALRHSLATHMLRAGADIRHVQQILGHAAIHATEVYTHLVASDVADAHARSHPRGRRKKR
jgi:integrase/recombinase XerD